MKNLLILVCVVYCEVNAIWWKKNPVVQEEKVLDVVRHGARGGGRHGARGGGVVRHEARGGRVVGHGARGGVVEPQYENVPVKPEYENVPFNKPKEQGGAKPKQHKPHKDAKPKQHHKSSMWGYRTLKPKPSIPREFDTVRRSAEDKVHTIDYVTFWLLPVNHKNKVKLQQHLLRLNSYAGNQKLIVRADQVEKIRNMTEIQLIEVLSDADVMNHIDKNNPGMFKHHQKLYLAIENYPEAHPLKRDVLAAVYLSIVMKNPTIVHSIEEKWEAGCTSAMHRRRRVTHFKKNKNHHFENYSNDPAPHDEFLRLDKFNHGWSIYLAGMASEQFSVDVTVNNGSRKLLNGKVVNAIKSLHDLKKLQPVFTTNIIYMPDQYTFMKYMTQSVKEVGNHDQYLLGPKALDEHSIVEIVYQPHRWEREDLFFSNLNDPLSAGCTLEDLTVSLQKCVLETPINKVLQMEYDAHTFRFEQQYDDDDDDDDDDVNDGSGDGDGDGNGDGNQKHVCSFRGVVQLFHRPIGNVKNAQYLLQEYAFKPRQMAIEDDDDDDHDDDELEELPLPNPCIGALPKKEKKYRKCCDYCPRECCRQCDKDPKKCCDYCPPECCVWC